jgi:hypothetical protein
MVLKDTLAPDLATFINLNEFADLSTFVLGSRVIQTEAVIDSSVANDFEGAQIRGVFESTVVVYTKQGSLVPLPSVGSALKLNGLMYLCRDVRVEQGLDILTLERKAS